jgi:hypothetical protein
VKFHNVVVNLSANIDKLLPDVVKSANVAKLRTAKVKLSIVD